MTDLETTPVPSPRGMPAHDDVPTPVEGAEPGPVAAATTDTASGADAETDDGAGETAAAASAAVPDGAEPAGSAESGLSFGFIEALPMAAFFVDRDYVIRYINHAGVQGMASLGIEQADVHLVGRSFSVVYDHPVHGAALTATGELLPSYDTSVVGEESLETTFSAVYDAQGVYVGGLAVGVNVTARVAAEKMTARVTSMMENSPTNMMFADRDLIIRYMNPASLETLRGLEAFLPVKADEVIGSSLDIFHKTPSYQRGLLADPSQLPRRANIAVGPETLDLLVSPITDTSGEYVGAMATWEVVTEKLRAEQEAAQSAADTAAVNGVLSALAGATSADAAIQLALDIVRREFGWAYGSSWRLDPAVGMLTFSRESGDVAPEFRRATVEASFAEGVGLPGRAWAQRDVVFVREVAEMADCVRAPIAQRVGVRSGVCLPIMVAGEVIGTMDFVATEALDLSPLRLDALRNVGRLISQAIEKQENEAAERAEAEETARRVAVLLDVVRAAAAGDLTRAVEVDGDDNVGHMAAGLRTLIEALRTNMSTIGTTADSVSVAAEQLTVLSHGMGEGASLTSDRAASASSASVQISASIQTVATAAEEMTASIREIAKNATEAASVATDAVSVASEAQGTVASLGESSAEIGQVIKVITSIAQQTNLLALNATIEAARAGDAGKGFAVVANEVKELAKETAKATDEIGQKIEAIQSDTAGAVGAISRIAEVIARINDIQTTIASAVEEQTATTNEIARSVTEAAAGANGIAEDVTQVASAAADTRQGAQNTLQSATELTGMAGELNKLVGQFKL